MKAIIWILAGFATISTATTADACGDKFLVVGRGVRPKQLAGITMPASILIYQNPSAESANVSSDPELQATLMKAGHSVALAEDTRTLHEALLSGQYDIIVAALSDALRLKKEADAAPSKPIVLPVIYNPTARALKEASNVFACVLTRPGKTSRLLDAVDQAMRLRK